VIHSHFRLPRETFPETAGGVDSMFVNATEHTADARKPAFAAVMRISSGPGE
jgi:hypothetical protein